MKINERRFLKISIGLILFICVMSSCDYYHLPFLCRETPISKTEALKIGKEKLEKFLTMEGISLQKVSSPEISSSKDVPWVLDYRSNNRDQIYYFVRVTIDSCGAIETSGESRGVYKNNTTK